MSRYCEIAFEVLKLLFISPDHSMYFSNITNHMNPTESGVNNAESY